MDDYLSKPLRLNELGRMLTKWLHLTTVVSEAPPEAVPPAPTSSNTIWDATALTSLVGDNPGMHRRLLEKFLPSSREQVIAIDAAAQSGETNRAADLAHKLKSSARSVGALQLGDLCMELECAGRAGDEKTCRTLSKHVSAAFAAAAAEIEKTLEAPVTG